MDESEIIRKALKDSPDMDPVLRKILEEKLTPRAFTIADDDDETVVLCGYWPSIINGSKLVLCSTCKTRCCIAPSTQHNLKDYKGKIRLLCLACFQANPPKEPPNSQKA